jgi:hypothetical protein
VTKIKNQVEIDFILKEIYIFNKEGVYLSHTRFKNYADNNFVINYSKLNKLIKDLYRDKDVNNCLPVNWNRSVRSNNENNHNPTTQNTFEKIYLNNHKIFFLLKSGLVFVGIFNQVTNSSLIKLYLLHLHSAFLNYIGENNLNLNSKQEESPRLTDKTINIPKYMFPVKIFEVLINNFK